MLINSFRTGMVMTFTQSRFMIHLHLQVMRKHFFMIFENHEGTFLGNNIGV